MSLDNNFDKAGKNGFDIPPKQLAHELTIAKLAADASINSIGTEWEYYDYYTKTYNTFLAAISDHTRFDADHKTNT